MAANFKLARLTHFSSLSFLVSLSCFSVALGGSKSFALPPLSAALQNQPAAHPSGPVEIDALVQRADHLHDSGEFPDALVLYRQAAEAGNSHAMYRVGSFYERGYVVKQDLAEALHWYQKARAAGSGEASGSIGYMYSVGRGVNRDDAQAFRYLQEGAERGNHNAMTNLGFFYYDGRGVAQDVAHALFWFEKAASLSNTPAMIKLGYIYSNGTGVPKDEEAGRRWFQKAADLGNSKAKEALRTFDRAPFDLSGEWDGHDVFMTYSIRVVQSDHNMTADRYLADNRKNRLIPLLHGSFPSHQFHFPVQMAVYRSGLGGLFAKALEGIVAQMDDSSVPLPPPSNWAPADFSIQDPDHFRVGNISFARVSPPPLDDVPCYPDNPLGIDGDFSLARGQRSLVAGHHADAACWYGAGAVQGNSSAMVSLADLQRQGLGLKQNIPSARFWLQRAANSNNMDANLELAGMYDLGEGGQVDHSKAESMRSDVYNFEADQRAREVREARANYFEAVSSSADACSIRDRNYDRDPYNGLERETESEYDSYYSAKMDDCRHTKENEQEALADLNAILSRPVRDPAVESKARSIVPLFPGNQFEAVTAQFDAALKASRVTPITMRKTWGNIVNSLGTYKGIIAVTQSNKQAAQGAVLQVADVLCSFGHGRLNIRILFDSSRKIAGLWFQDPPLRFWPSQQP